MNYASIHLADMANGLGMRTSLFVSGCRHHCKGCFNQEAWDFSYGEPYTDEVERYILSTMELPEIDGLTILGGEPMDKLNQPHILNLIKKTKEMGKSVWIYTGYMFEDLAGFAEWCHGPWTNEILHNTDVLVDGEFVQDLKDISLKFRGSRNQRVIDVQKSLWEGKVSLLID